MRIYLEFTPAVLPSAGKFSSACSHDFFPHSASGNFVFRNNFPFVGGSQVEVRWKPTSYSYERSLTGYTVHYLKLVHYLILVGRGYGGSHRQRALMISKDVEQGQAATLYWEDTLMGSPDMIVEKIP